MKNIFKKIVAMFVMVAVMFVQTTPVVVLADETTPTPTAEVTQQPEPTQTEPTVAPTTQPEVTPSQPTPEPTLTPEQKKAKEREIREAQKKAAEEAWLANYNANKNKQTSPTPSGVPQNGGGNNITTDDANNSSAVITDGNTNASAGPVGAVVSGAFVNSDNGAGSLNNGSSASIVNNNTNQDNSATVNNDLNQSATTGNNQSSMNVGDSKIKTGNANVSGTAITAVNTNVDGVAVSEFNFVDDHKGDIVLDQNAFAANCILGCGTGTGSAVNSGNGAESNNNASSSAQSNNTTNQNNNATIGNNMTLNANTGSNSGNFNTGGDTSIETGDANINANSLTFANNNIAGNVQFGVVNIYGNFEGDIILPEFTNGPVTPNGAATANTNNGAGSNNAALADSSVNNNTFQGNNVTINNDLVLNGTTGDNTADYNTGGNSTVKTGDTNVVANVLNIANTNISGGNYFLVLVNQAGNWVGKLMGYPEGSNVAVSTGLELQYGADGQITATNNGVANADNGAMSNNNANSSSAVNNTTNQTNNGVINNTMNLNANTGGNSTNFNTGGDNTIKTGDATIIANMVNFVNNNIVNGAKLNVLLVNVFGTFNGNIYMGQKPSPTPAPTSVVANNNTNSENKTETKKEAVSETTKDETTKVVDEENGSVATTTKKTYSGSKYAEKNVKKVNETKVAGAQATNNNLFAQAMSGDDESKKKLTLNLAWFVIALPIFGLLFFGKKLLARRFTK